MEQWCLFYQNILKHYQAYNNCFFIIYEELINPNYVQLLVKKLYLNNFQKINLNYFKNSNKKEMNINYTQENYNQAKKIYVELKHKSTFNNLFT